MPGETTSASVSTKPLEESVDIESLIHLLTKLVRVLGENGFGGAALEGCFQNHFSARCLLCGISLSGSDLREIAFASVGLNSQNKKLERVRLGFCARNNCQGRFYSLRLDGHPGIDWARIWADLKSQPLAADEEPVATPETSPDTERSTANRKQQHCARLLLVAATVLALLWWAKGNFYIPGISPKPRVFIVLPPQ